MEISLQNSAFLVGSHVMTVNIIWGLELLSGQKDTLQEGGNKAMVSCVTTAQSAAVLSTTSFVVSLFQFTTRIFSFYWNKECYITGRKQQWACKARDEAPSRNIFPLLLGSQTCSLLLGICPFMKSSLGNLKLLM